MAWRFRKYFNLGMFRIGISKNGLGFSFGIPGFRYGISPNGNKFISIGIPGTGLYWSKNLENTPNQIENHASLKLTDNQIILSKLKEKRNKI
jgi:hypothetical protein